MIFPAPLLAAALLGFLFLFHVFQKSRFPFKLLFCILLSPAAGLSLCSLILFFAYLVSGAQGKFLSFSFYNALSVFLILRILSSKSLPLEDLPGPSLREKLIKMFQRGHLPKEVLWSRFHFFLSIAAFGVFFFTFFNFIRLFISASCLGAYGGWDARFFWNVKASFYFRDPALWKNMFSPILSWTHQDYPLMLPGSVAWGWNWWGKEALIWPAVVSLVFILSLAVLIVWYLVSYSRAWSAWIGAAFFFTLTLYAYWAVNQYADVPLTFFMTAAGVLLVMAFNTKDNALFFMSGWMAGMTAWTKNEGLFFVVEIMLIALLAQGRWQGRERQGNTKNGFLHLIQGAALPCFAVLILKMFLGKTGDYVGSSRSLSDYFALLFNHQENTRFILVSFRSFLFNQAIWCGLWLFFFAAVPSHFILCRHKTQPYSWILSLLTGSVLAGYFIVLHLSPHDVRWQISTALARLLLHPGVLALIFTFETFSPPTFCRPDIDSSI